MAKSKKIKRGRRGGVPKSSTASTTASRASSTASRIQSTITNVSNVPAKTNFIMNLMKLTSAQLANPHVSTFQHGNEVDKNNQKDFIAIADDYKNALTEHDMIDAIHQCRIPEGYKPFLIREVREIYRLKVNASKWHWLHQLVDGVFGARFSRATDEQARWAEERREHE